MGKAKSVAIAGRHFTTQRDAISYFMNQREALLTTKEFSSGELFDTLNDLYTRYCDNSPGWELNGRLITAFSVEFEPRCNDGVWASHPCYKVHFSNREIRPFSIEKAVKAISSLS